MMTRTVAWTLMGAFAAMLLGAAAARAENVVTHHYDNQRTGWNSSESLLTPTTVAGGSFNLQHSVALDEQVDAQPLLLTGQTIAGAGQHDVVYVATEGNSLYAIDAQSGAVLIEKNFGTPVPQSTLPGACGNNASVVGIAGTPVIDASAGILYFIAYVYEGGKPNYYLHGVNVDTLADAVPPVLVSASGKLTNGKAYGFAAQSNRQRPALLLANGNIYAGFGSFCELNANKSRGWVLGWHAGTLEPLPANQLNNKRATSPNNYFLTSVWMSGAGPAASTAGDVYFVTGNTDFDGTQYNAVTNLSESAVQVSGDLTTVDGLYTPSGGAHGHVVLDQQDFDFGSGGILLLPPQAGIETPLAVAAGKVGIMYLLNADNLGNHSSSATGSALGQVSIGDCWCAESYYTAADGAGRIVTSGGTAVEIWKVQGGTKVSLVKEATSGPVANGQNPGFFTSVSSNGAATPVIWAVGHPVSTSSTALTLYAFDDNGKQLYAGAAGNWPYFYADANVVPVVANGRVYVAGYQSLAIFGLGAPAAQASRMSPPAIQVELSAGQRELFGTVQSIEGFTYTVITRSDGAVKVDAAAAFARFLAAPTAVGRGVVVRGSIDDAGVMHAETLMHAPDDPALWPTDR